MEFSQKPSLFDIPGEFRDLLNKEYTTDDKNVVYKMTIPLIYNVSFDYPNMGYLDIKEHPEKLFMDLYERKPMTESLNDLDFDFLRSITSYGRLAGFLTIVGKVNASEKIMADLPND